MLLNSEGFRRVILRPISADDTENIVRWRNDESVRKNLYTQELLTAEQHLSYLKKVVETGKCFQYIIEARDTAYTGDIGTVFLKNVDEHSHKCEFGIFIGESEARGKGFASLATEAVLAIAFEKLSMNRVYLSVMADNTPAIKAYERAGFLPEGRLHEDYLKSDGYVDVILMGITKTNWQNFVKQKK